MQRLIFIIVCLIVLQCATSPLVNANHTMVKARPMTAKSGGITVKQPIIYPGQTLTVYFKPDYGIQFLQGEFLSGPVHWYPFDGGFRAFIPVPLGVEPGYYQLKTNWRRGMNQDGSCRVTGEYEEEITRVQIKKGKAAKVVFSVPKTKKQLLAPAVVQDDWQFIEAVLTVEATEGFWSAPFVWPVKNYYITLGFGVRETVNGQKRGQHRGLDMNSAQKEKSNILAINAGQVVLAQSFQVFGGTVVIDHGQGIHSLYYHLSKILVQPGQMVKKGQVLGKMGTTGVSSGVHLHLGISVYNVRVDPRQWLTGNI
jgi:hypothetical protein